MTRFSKLNPDGTETEIREIAQTDIMKCPHMIMMADHYRDDATCRCNDSTHTVMAVWGYVWDDTKWTTAEEGEE